MARRKPKAETRTVQFMDGRWYRVKGYTHHVCCDCGLTHRHTLKLEDGELFEQWTIDDEETRQQRRQRKP